MKKLLLLEVLAFLCWCGGYHNVAGQAPLPNSPNIKDPELWASPRELRTKRMIGTGQYSLQSVSNKVTPRFLADHPDFISSHPFDGVTLVVPLAPVWLKQHDLAEAAGAELDFLAWSKLEIPYAAVQDTVADLNRVSWRHLTDNFLWFRMLNAHRHNPEVNYAADFTNDGEWSIVEKNAALMARICRETNLKGFMLDTEQYAKFSSGQAYPMGKDSPALLQKRGAQWIKAVQAEYPAITIVITFAWSEDLDQAEFLAGVKPFLNGVLEGIQEPARLVHGHENTFYFGHAPGTKYVSEGLPGGRSKYQGTREAMKNWRSLSSSPEKYDNFVKFGMAAWVESDPWDIQGASGSKYTVWSNLPLALAYSDEYVWVWSEYTNYGQSFVSGNEPNPFLLSVSNQTFNTGREAVTSITEDFATNPLLRGWYFDFDMLDVGRKKDPSHAVPIFSADVVPYVWSKDDRAVRIQGTWMTGANGDKVAKLGQQRRRYVHPLQAVHKTDIFHAEFVFQVKQFGSDADNPLIMGLFNSGELVNRQSLILRIEGPARMDLTLAGDGQPWRATMAVKGGLETGVDYQLTFDYDGQTDRLQAQLVNIANSALVAQITTIIPSSIGWFAWDEIGAAQWDANPTATPADQAYEYYLRKVSLHRKPDRWVSPVELRQKKVIGAGIFSTLNLGDPEAPIPKFLAEHPEYLANYPFDGLAIPVRPDPDWCLRQGLKESSYELHSLVMTKLAIPYALVQDAVADLQRVSWGHVTDNFLWYSIRDGSDRGDKDERYAIDPDSPHEWEVAAANAALCARVCREANLQGFMLDTEMYSNYASGELYPFGKGTPEVWRRRGQAWIRAVQAEFPAIKILLFFSWGPEHEPGGWPGYENLKPFMNGILEGIQAPARLIHGWESTFWYGGTRILEGKPYVYPGNRAAYARDRHNIRHVWRNLSDNPEKYDQFVDVGLAAWVESDPYNLWPGQPSGYRTQLPWSNLLNTLAYSDEYVWVWSEFTHYAATRDTLNPFLAAIANQTFNTGKEPALSLVEDFRTDPLRRGWYFDFDMLDIGRELRPEYLPVMTTDSLAYAWSDADRSVRIFGTWLTGTAGKTVAQLGCQRRRYVHPIKTVSDDIAFRAEFDFQVENFGADPANPIIIGLFNSKELVDRQSLSLRIDNTRAATLVLAGRGEPWSAKLEATGGLQANTPYRLALTWDGPARRLQAQLTNRSSASLSSDFTGMAPASLGQFQCDEIGVAQWDAAGTSTPVTQAYRYQLQRLTFVKN